MKSPPAQTILVKLIPILESGNAENGNQIVKIIYREKSVKLYISQCRRASQKRMKEENRSNCQAGYCLKISGIQIHTSTDKWLAGGAMSTIITFGSPFNYYHRFSSSLAIYYIQISTGHQIPLYRQATRPRRPHIKTRLPRAIDPKLPLHRTDKSTVPRSISE